MTRHNAELITVEVANVSDEDLVRQVLAGDRDAYAPLVERYEPTVRWYLAGRGLRSAELDDVAQEVFVRVYQRLGDLREPKKFSGYLMTTAARLVVDSHRGRPWDNSISLDDVAAEQREDDFRLARREALQQAVIKLPEGMQVMLGLKYGDGKTASEIATVLGQSVNSITKTLSRAYQRLRSDRNLMQAWNEEESP